MATILLPALVGSVTSAPVWLGLAALGGYYIDQAWLSQDITVHQYGPRAQDVRLSGSSYGSVIPRIWGAYRLPGNIIWASDLVEHTRTHTQTSGSGKRKVTTSYTEYYYTCSFAIAICRGPILAIRKIWADNKLIYHVGPDANDSTIQASNDLSRQMTSYFGTETQQPHSFMSPGGGSGTGKPGHIWIGKPGRSWTGEPRRSQWIYKDTLPAYRGIAYIVFQDLNLEKWGNRIPSLNFEVIQKGYDAGVGYASTPVNVSEIISDLCLDAGYTEDDFDVTDVHGTIHGFCATGNSFMEDISSLCKIAGISWRQYGRKLVFFPQEQSNVIVIPRQDIGAGEGENETVKIVTTNKNQLPTAVDVEYFDVNKDYLTSVQSATRYTGQNENRLSMNTQIATDANTARTAAYRTLTQMWNGACEYTFKLGPKWLHLVPGDVLDITTLNGDHHIVQIKEMTIGADYSIEILARTYDSTVFAIEEEGDSGEDIGFYDQIEIGGYTDGLLSNLPLLPGIPDEIGFCAFANGENPGWRFAMLYESTDGGSTYSIIGQIPSRGLGKALNVIGQGPSQVWDRDNYIDVYIPGLHINDLEMISLDEDEVLRGSNAIVVGNEIIQFCNAELIAENTYRLTKLLRGRRGTEWAINGHQANEKVGILMPGRMTFIAGDIYGINKENYYKFVANDMSQEFIDPVLFSYNGETKKPFSPVHCIYHGDGKYSWTRRSRVGLELTSNPPDIPLGEAYERYSVKLYKGGTLVKQYTVNSPEVTVDMNIEKDQIRICQLSDVIGEGHALVVDLDQNGGVINEKFDF